MKNKNKVKHIIYFADVKIKTFIPKSRKKRKQLCGSGKCSIERCKKILRSKYKGMFHGYLYGMPSSKITFDVCSVDPYTQIAKELGYLQAITILNQTEENK